MLTAVLDGDRTVTWHVAAKSDLVDAHDAALIVLCLDDELDAPSIEVPEGFESLHAHVLALPPVITIPWVDRGAPDLAPSCGEAGVLGVLCGVMGNIQATEAIKVLLGIGDTLSGRLLIYDALGMTFTELKVRRDPDCPSCGPDADLQLRDYEAWCAGVGTHDPAGAPA